MSNKLNPLRFDIIGNDKSGQAFDAAERNAKQFGGEVTGLMGVFDKASISAGDIFAVFSTGVVAGAVASVQRVVDEVSELSNQAEQAVVGFEEFQELKFYMDRNRVGVDALTDGLKEMNLRVDEFIQTDGGPAEESLRRLGYSTEELAEKLKRPSELFEEIIARTKQLEKAAQVRVLDELFGGQAGEQFIQIMDDSVGAIAAARQEARDLGIVLEDEYLENVADINRRWKEMVTVVGVNLQRAILNAAGAANQFLDNFRQIENVTDRGIDQQITEMGKKRLELETKILEVRDSMNGGFGFFNQDSNKNMLADLELRMQKLNEAEAKLVKLRADREDQEATRKTVDGEIVKNQKFQLAIANLNEEKSLLSQTALQREINNQLKEYGFTLDSKEGQLIADQVTQIYNKKMALKAANDSSKDAVKQSEKQAEAYQKVIDALDLEYAKLGQNATQQRILTEIRRAGVEVGSLEAQEIIARIELIDRETAALEEANKASEFFNQQFESGILSLIPAIETGNDALDNFLNTMIKVAAQSLLFGTGPLGGMFGGGILSGLFPGRALGGDVSAGQAYEVGETGKELFIPSQNGQIVSHSDLVNAENKNLSAANNQPISVTQINKFDGYKAGDIEQLKRQMAQNDIELGERVRGIIRQGEEDRMFA